MAFNAIFVYCKCVFPDVMFTYALCKGEIWAIDIIIACMATAVEFSDTRSLMIAALCS